MKKIMNIDDMKRVVLERWTELEDIPEKYLNDVGFVAKETYRTLLWHLSFHDDIESLKQDDGLANLINIPDKHTEYYRIIRMFNRRILDIT